MPLNSKRVSAIGLSLLGEGGGEGEPFNLNCSRNELFFRRSASKSSYRGHLCTGVINKDAKGSGDPEASLCFLTSCGEGLVRGGHRKVYLQPIRELLVSRCLTQRD